MSHELRTPLNSIIAFNTLLMESTPNEDHKEILKDSLTSAQDLLRIITQLLDHVRTESPVAAVAAGESQGKLFLVSRVVDDILDIIAEKSFKHGVDVLASYPASGPSLVGNMKDLRQAILNLCEISIESFECPQSRDRFLYISVFHGSVPSSCCEGIECGVADSVTIEIRRGSEEERMVP
eukprot:CAMPEP_0172202942 /NCGR_PEP_ID=MMETSP1050-20130122/30974_1 /TAXON_ID=233186 /ORGANISM="Cryptomonas curvata, Strain CCAP979/52" /LENGTH=179 /DNA_ID=CAMNT_0012881033 /DNA_START=33 /DNA_END=569 /DNA_ORIENTATION=+